MYSAQVNLFSVLIAAVLFNAIGFLWYSKKLLGNKWQELTKQTDNTQSNYRWQYLITFVASIIFAYLLAQFINALGATSLLEGLLVGFWFWLGFTATMGLVDYIFSNKSILLFIINYGYYLISFMIIGAFLAVFN